MSGYETHRGTLLYQHQLDFSDINLTRAQNAPSTLLYQHQLDFSEYQPDPPARELHFAPRNGSNQVQGNN